MGEEENIDLNITIQPKDVPADDINWHNTIGIIQRPQLMKYTDDQIYLVGVLLTQQPQDVQSVFLTGTPSKSFKYKKVNLG